MKKKAKKTKKAKNRKDLLAVHRWMSCEGLLQVAAADRIGCTQSLVSNFLHGGHELSPAQMKKWARATGIPIEIFAIERVKAA